jgi:hypothetical protein
VCGPPLRSGALAWSKGGRPKKRVKLCSEKKGNLYTPVFKSCNGKVRGQKVQTLQVLHLRAPVCALPTLHDRIHTKARGRSAASVLCFFLARPPAFVRWIVASAIDPRLCSLLVGIDRSISPWPKKMLKSIQTCSTKTSPPSYLGSDARQTRAGGMRG